MIQTNEKTRLKYICCDATVQVGGSINGCKKQKRAAGQVLDKRMIDMWATACFENPEYNE